MGVLWLSARAECILKCNMIPSLLLLFLPSWIIFTVFKGMLSLSVLPSGPHVSSRALVSLCSHHSLSCSSPQIISPVSLNVSPQPLGHTCHSAACSLLTLLMPPAPDLSSAQCFPRPSPLDAVLSIALQSVSTPAACPVLSCPEPVHWELVLWAITSQPHSALFPTTGLVCPEPLYTLIVFCGSSLRVLHQRKSCLLSRLLFSER